MHPISDWSARKQEISNAFLRAAHLPHESDDEIYAGLLARLGVTTRQDYSILCSIVQDAIMKAVREERPTTPLTTFLDWLNNRLLNLD